MAIETVGRGARVVTTVVAATEGAVGEVARVPAVVLRPVCSVAVPQMVVATVAVTVVGVAVAGGLLNDRVGTHIHCTCV